jgi:glycine betaine catabolism B
MVMTLPIREVLPATPRARIIRLDLGGREFPYRPGQAVYVGMHGNPERTAYSLAGAPEDASRGGCLELLVGTDAAGSPRGPLNALAGARLDIEGPIGQFTFPVEPAERRFLFIAAGTGIAPLRAMLRHAMAVPHREICMVYSARTAVEFAYHDEFQALARDGRITLRQTVTRDADCAGWSGGRGRITRDDLEPLVHNPATLCFICGPLAFVQHSQQLLGELGVAAEQIVVEPWARPKAPAARE